MHVVTYDWDDLRAVMHLVQDGSLAAAATELGVSYTTVARRITRLETALGRTLFERLADGYRPTDAGRLVATHAGQMDDHAHAMIRQLQGRDNSLDGSLTITASQLLIAHVLNPVIDMFCQRHPGVSLDIRATNSRLDLNRREADLAIRISADPGDTLKGLRLTQQSSAGFATQAVADQIATNRTGLIDWIVHTDHRAVPDGVDLSTYPNHRIKMTFDDMVAIRAAVQAGLGVARMPFFLGRGSGLVQVPVLPPHPYPEVWVVGHPDVWVSAKVAAFRNILVPYIKSIQGQFIA